LFRTSLSSNFYRLVHRIADSLRTFMDIEKSRQGGDSSGHCFSILAGKRLMLLPRWKWFIRQVAICHALIPGIAPSLALGISLHPR